MLSINPYLNFDGKTEEAFNFYKSVFGGEFRTIMRFGETPADASMGTSPEDSNRIMHVALPIGNGSTLMGSDTPVGRPPVPGNNSWMSLQTSDKNEADKLFNGLSAGGQVIMPLESTFWGAYFGMFIDKFGTQWMINCELKKD